MTMTETEEKILNAAIQTFVRYGARKASMNDIAHAAGVSRQTLYDAFGGKDGLIRASIRIVTDRNLAQVRAALEGTAELSDQLDTYFANTIVKSFELLQTAGDMEDLISGHNTAGKEEIERSHARHEKLIAELLAPYEREIQRNGLTVTQQAHFIVTTVMGFKNGAKTREDLNSLLMALKASVLRVAKVNLG
ncbi:TetR/AcrR family transcriptional regulator [Shimia sp. R9_1]|uniref:TetR/AcrR family transcriptional regulator n=1 Tax=Shimia sp. R9_1 TaxID=2821111 RepID=UPI001ADB905E|nr:TetR/AcrR family transcriptional regulator [Shimia sp. R9_1]MBO9407846.1 TetR/AcrR family transcriptional regulator [Shimia sp. R9_1]